MREDAICHRDPERFALLYTLLWRLTHGEKSLLMVASDPLVHRLRQMQKSVRRDTHKMTAFVRFRQVEDDAGERYVAWFEPEHHILRRVSSFFVDRFAAMRWSILTPEGSLHWDTANADVRSGGRQEPRAARRRLRGLVAVVLSLDVQSGARQPDGAARRDAEEILAQPAGGAAHSRHAGGARQRTERMIEAEPLAPRDAPRLATGSRHRRRRPARLKRSQAQAAAASAARCGSPRPRPCSAKARPTRRWCSSASSPATRRIWPGKPFVGPAGQMFDRALAEAGIDRSRVYVTNAVKHFKYEPRGKRRIHKTPNNAEVDHCRWWVDSELDLIKPQLTVALGATAARALTGRSVTISRERGRLISFGDGRTGLITVHPSFLLRLPDQAAQAAEYRRFVDDLRLVGPRTAGHPQGRLSPPQQSCGRSACLGMNTRPRGRSRPRGV